MMIIMEMKKDQTSFQRKALTSSQRLISIPLFLLVLSVIEVSKLQVSSLSRGRGIPSNPLGIQTRSALFQSPWDSKRSRASGE